VLYSVVTLHLGIRFHADEYKIMGLAPYGNPARFRSFFRESSRVARRRNDPNPTPPYEPVSDEREYLGTRQSLADHLVKPRQPNEEVKDEHRDVSAALQECLDLVMLHLCGNFGKRTGLRRLALAGGVALNCTANESFASWNV